MASQQTKKPGCCKASKVHDWEIGLVPMIMSMVKHVVAFLDALEVAFQPGLLLSFVAAPGCYSTRLENASPLATLAIAKHVSAPDPMLGGILSIAYLLMG